MRDDADGGDGTEPPDHVPVSQEDTLRAQVALGKDELSRPTRGLALSGLSAGLDIGFGPLFMLALISVAAGVWSQPTVQVATSLVYAVGFVFVVLSGTELFTEHTTLAVLPVLNGEATLTDLAHLWGVVYATNLVGGTVFALGMVRFGPAYGVIDPEAFVTLAEPLVGHALVPTLVAAVLAGWLMGLLSWMVTSVKGSETRIMLVVVIASVIGFAHLPHSIAGNVEVAAAVFASAAITVGDYARFLVVATVGNVVGGTVFVAPLKYGYVIGGLDG